MANRTLVIVWALALAGFGCGNPQGSTMERPMPTGSTWRLITLGEAEQPVPEEIDITLTFTEEDRIAGSAGCNRYFGSYEQAGDTFRISQVGTTRMACAPPVMEQEQQFLAALESVEGWNQQENQLTLLNGAGEPVLHFMVQEEARLSGVDFRATGNEPGWHLEIREGESIRFVYAYGEREVTALAPVPDVDETVGQTIYYAETEANKLTVTIIDEACADSMSGEAFDQTVTVELDGTTYRGCGRALSESR